MRSKLNTAMDFFLSVLSWLSLLAIGLGLIGLVSCGRSTYVGVPVPGPTTEVEVIKEVEVERIVEVEKIVEVPPPELPPVKCEIWNDLSSNLLGSSGSTQNLPLTHSVKGDKTIYLEKISLTTQINPNLPFDEFLGTDAETLTTNFAMRCVFKMAVSIAGSYKFSLESDDGSQVHVNGALVINNGGFHSMTLKTGNVTLPQGTHEVRVSYFQGGGAKGLKLKVTGPSQEKEI